MSEPNCYGCKHIKDVFGNYVECGELAKTGTHMFVNWYYWRDGSPDECPLKAKADKKEEPKRWKDVFHYGFGYTVCPYCGDETGWYNPASQRFQSDLENNQRERCPKCGKRVYARKGWIMNQPPENTDD